MPGSWCRDRSRPPRSSPWKTTTTWRASADRYRHRLGRLAEILRAAGLEAEMPAGGFYLWVPVPAWAGHTGRGRGPARGLGAHRRAGRGGRHAREPGRVLRCAGGRLRADRGRPTRRPHRVGGHASVGVGPSAPGACDARAAVQGATARPGNLGPWPTCPPRSKSCGPGSGELSPADTDALDVVAQAIDLLDRGEARVAEVDGSTGDVVVHSWLKTAILLLFRLRAMETAELGPFEYHDKLPAQDRIRVGRCPGGARARRRGGDRSSTGA